MKVIEYANAMGLDMIQGDHEDAPGQLELNWTYDNVLRNADYLGYFSIFLAGIINDVVIGIPIGISSFCYLLI